MLKIVSLLACVALAVATTPPKCGQEYQCPPYTVKRTHGNLELREYPASTWIKADDSSSYSWFWDLFGYIQGDNSRNLKIDMTAPVIKTRSMSQSQSGNMVMGDETDMSFYLAIDNPPQPNNSQLKIDEWPVIKIWVKSFGGWAYTYRLRGMVEELIDELPSDANVDKSKVYVAGYDSPMTFMNRHNEVGFLVQD